MVGEPVGQQPEHQHGLQKGVCAAVTQAQPGDPRSGFGDDRFVHGGERFRGADRVVAESLGHPPRDRPVQHLTT
jgi:hypothetical protein